MENGAPWQYTQIFQPIPPAQLRAPIILSILGNLHLPRKLPRLVRTVSLIVLGVLLVLAVLFSLVSLATPTIIVGQFPLRIHVIIPSLGSSPSSENSRPIRPRAPCQPVSIPIISPLVAIGGV